MTVLVAAEYNHVAGLEPATSGVTGRRAKPLRSLPSAARVAARLTTEGLASKSADLVKHLVIFNKPHKIGRAYVEHLVTRSVVEVPPLPISTLACILLALRVSALLSFG